MRQYRLLSGCIGGRYRQRLRTYRAIDTFKRAALSSACKTCIDLGANVGEYTRKMAATAKRVIAFEPDPWMQIPGGFDRDSYGI